MENKKIKTLKLNEYQVDTLVILLNLKLRERWSQAYGDALHDMLYQLTGKNHDVWQG